MARFGAGILRTLPELVRTHRPTGVFTVADRKVVELHGPPLAGARLLLDAAEPAKTLDTWRVVLDALVAEGLDRDALLVACGGGVVLDVAGFAAAAYLRGIRWLAVPSTLLAMVDAAHGGKTGVDHPAAKNLVGAFHAPVDAIADTDLLATLPPSAVEDGLAEVVKHAVIGAPSLLDRAGRDDPASFVGEAAQVKLEIVARDPFEQGERRHLNLGHTLGHALERASDYRLRHGEAVAVGLRAACRIAEHHCGFAQSAAVHEALDRCGLPRRAAVGEQDALAALRHDKKRRGGRLRWVLPQALGRVEVFDDVPDALVADALRASLTP
ncbi:MAG: 3-dehydroquinate synthase [Planctomycetota bacterium]